MDEKKLAFLKEQAKKVRNTTIEIIGTLGVGHIGGSSSIVELLTAIYYETGKFNPKDPKDPDRDRVVLSKGHAGPALYAVLAEKGFFDRSLIKTLNQPHTLLPSHVDMNRTPGVDMTAGSLGQGLSAAVGMAVAGKLDKKDYTVYAIIGDGESQEGQIWEASMFAGNHALDNLIVILDYNKMQIDGTVEDINDIYPVVDKWKAFKFNVINIEDGHDIPSIVKAINDAKATKGKPTMIVLNTIKGKCIGKFEGQVGSHSISVSKEEWDSFIVK